MSGEGFTIHACIMDIRVADKGGVTQFPQDPNQTLVFDSDSVISPDVMAKHLVHMHLIPDLLIREEIPSEALYVVHTLLHMPADRAHDWYAGVGILEDQVAADVLRQFVEDGGVFSRLHRHVYRMGDTGPICSIDDEHRSGSTGS